MSTQTTSARPVVVGYEDHHSEAALRWAAREALRVEAPLRVVHAYSPETMYPWGYGYPLPAGDIREVEDAVREQATQTLREAAAQVQEQNHGLEVIETLACSGAAAALVEASQDGLTVVVGHRPRHHWSPALGSVSLPVAAHSACPVVVVPTPSDETPPPADSGGGSPQPADGRVVLGLEDSQECADAAGFAFAQAQARGAGLMAVHAWWVDPALAVPLVTDWDEVAEAQQLLTDNLLAPWRERYPDVDVTRVLARGRPTGALLSAAQGAELLVVGSRGRGGFASLLLGSVSRHVLAHAVCPVAVVRRGQLADIDAQAAIRP